MLKKLIILLFVIAPLSAIAQNKLAYINTEETIMQMPELKDVESKLAAKQEEIKKNVESMRKEYEDMLEKFKASQDSLTQSVLMDRQKQIEQIEERYQTYLENSNNELGQLRQQLFAPIQQKFQKALKEVGDEQGYTFILEAAIAPYISPSAVNAAPFVKTKLGIK